MGEHQLGWQRLIGRKLRRHDKIWSDILRMYGDGTLWAQSVPRALRVVSPKQADCCHPVEDIKYWSNQFKVYPMCKACSMRIDFYSAPTQGTHPTATSATTSTGPSTTPAMTRPPPSRAPWAKQAALAPLMETALSRRMDQTTEAVNRLSELVAEGLIAQQNTMQQNLQYQNHMMAQSLQVSQQILTTMQAQANTAQASSGEQEWSHMEQEGAFPDNVRAHTDVTQFPASGGAGGRAHTCPTGGRTPLQSGQTSRPERTWVFCRSNP